MLFSLAAILALSFVAAMVYQGRSPLRQWQRQMRNKVVIFERLYQGIDGFQLSLQARDGSTDPSYLYGEIECQAFAAALSLAQPKATDVFYDLGSGCGKAVIAAALTYPMKAYRGIEVLAPLHSAAITVRERLSGLSQASKLAEKIQFIHDDFLQHDFSDASVIFINATGFFSPLWEAIVAQLEQLPPGIRLLVSSKRLPTPAFELMHETQVLMSWGACHLRVYNKSQIP